MNCRCGYNGEGPHLCHGKAHTCRKPASQRFYNPHITALAGMQMKFGLHDTWACDECWEWFKNEYLAGKDLLKAQQ